VHSCPAGSGMISGQTGCYTCGINTYNNGSSLYCHACPPYQKALSGSSNCSYYQNFLTYKGKKYATLADSAVDVYGGQGQVGYLPLWNFTSIAADDADSRYVIASHYWSAYRVVVSGGCVYGTGSNNGGGWGCSPGYYLQQRGDEYAVPAGNGLQILITCKQLFIYLVHYEQYISSMS